MEDDHQNGVPLDPALLEVRKPDGTPYEVTPEGSLALLALGYKGLMVWRAKRREATLAGRPDGADHG